MREKPALNSGAFPITDAKAIDDLTAQITFKTSMFAFKASLANTVVVPEHVFKSVDPLKFTNDQPVVTGPFLLGDVSIRKRCWT